MAQVQVTLSNKLAASKVVIPTYRPVMLAATRLSGSEACPVFVLVGTDWIPVDDGSGTPLALSAAQPVTVLEGGPTYAVDKPVTASNCAIYTTELA